MFAVQAEGFVTHDGGGRIDATFYGYHVMANYWLTGETCTHTDADATWGRVKPKRNFHDGGGGRGAWVLALRYDHTDLTDGGIACIMRRFQYDF